MKSITPLILVICLISFFCDGMTVGTITKDIQNTGESPESSRKIKNPNDDPDNLLKEIFSDEKIVNFLALHGIDKTKVPNSPLLQYFLLVNIMQEKRSIDYTHRFGKGSNENIEQQKSYDVIFTPRMGKR
ncbi:uncharacterized protein LOC116340675 [Contarinia nasturtii]|uniref:uncharacterized protein LOC116340675 n=1 Tax=Contarinia nasturtii TaxID=265458 RepID=UPI0012D42232|nr:uncharacterized protein LOC116340675 [Contarinia nasturtii]